jgi:hypothetical protein
VLEIRKAAISLDEDEVLELERVITDRDEKEAMAFLKRCVYDRILHAQQGRLKSHIDTGDNPVDGFIKSNR